MDDLFPCIKDLELAAKNGEDTPFGLDIADHCLFIGLRYLYSMYRNGLITKIKGTEEKKRLLSEYTLVKSKIVFLGRQALSESKRIDIAAKRFKTEHTIEAADEMYNAFYNIK